MADRILVGKKGAEAGIWVSKPNNSVELSGEYLLSSATDMLKVWAQGSVVSYGINQSLGYWRHEISIDFPELPYIPLAFMGFKEGGAEPFTFPPNLRPLVTTTSFPNTGIVNYMPPVGISHNKILFKGFVFPYECRFNYTVFTLKIRDKF